MNLAADGPARGGGAGDPSSDLFDVSPFGSFPPVGGQTPCLSRSGSQGTVVGPRASVPLARAGIMA